MDDRYLRPKLYDFFATPDNENCLEKCYYYTKYAGTTGVVFSVYEMMLVSKPMTLVGCTGRFLNLSLPFFGAGAAYGAATYFSSRIRKKDDFVNHIAGSLAAVSVWVAKTNKMGLAFPCAIFIGSLMGYLKYMRQHNLPVFRMVPMEKRRYYPLVDLSVDLYKDPGRPKDWEPGD